MFPIPCRGLKDPRRLITASTAMPNAQDIPPKLPLPDAPTVATAASSAVQDPAIAIVGAFSAWAGSAHRQSMGPATPGGAAWEAEQPRTAGPRRRRNNDYSPPNWADPAASYKASIHAWAADASPPATGTIGKLTLPFAA